MPSRQSITRTAGALVATAGVGLMALAPAASAQTSGQDILVLRSSSLVRIDPSAPGTAIATTSISGLNPADQLIGIDLRPANNVLYGIGETGVIYTIDQTSGAATPGPTAATAPSGTAFGVDFNPAADRLRVVSNTGQSLRINVADGATTVDGSLAYGTADAGNGTSPSVVAAAYTNPDTDPNTATELFDIDSARDTLVIQDPPNDGVLSTRGALNADVTTATAFDIGAGNRAMAIIGGTLATVDVATGAATPVGAVPGGSASGMAFVAPLGQPTPTSTTSTSTAGATPTTRVQQELPRTGAEDLRLGAAGALLVALGGVLVAMAANRRALLR